MTPNQLPELRECPFCGSDESHTYQPDYCNYWHTICDNCSATGPARPTEYSAAQDWNNLRISAHGRGDFVTKPTDDERLLDIIAEKQANGWEHGTHPRDKAKIVLDAIRQYTTDEIWALEATVMDQGALLAENARVHADNLRLKAELTELNNPAPAKPEGGA